MLAIFYPFVTYTDTDTDPDTQTQTHTEGSRFVLIWFERLDFCCFLLVCFNQMGHGRVTLPKELCYTIAFMLNLFLLIPVPVSL